MKTLAAFGIILRRIDYGEADRIITLLTDDYGKIRVMAKGVRRQKSKMAGGIELFSVSEIHFIKGKGDIDTLVSSRLATHYGAIVKDLGRTQASYEALRLIDKVVEDRAGSEYFSVLNETLAAYNDERIPPALTELSFAMRLLQGLGHVPDFSRDSHGNSLADAENFEFDFEAVSFVARPDGPFTKNHLKLLKLLAHNPPQAVVAVQGVGELSAGLQPLIKSLVQYYVL